MNDLDLLGDIKINNEIDEDIDRRLSDENDSLIEIDSIPYSDNVMDQYTINNEKINYDKKTETFQYLDTYLNNVQLEKLNLSARSFNALKKEGYNYIKEIAFFTEFDYRKIRNLGTKSIKEIIKKVQQYLEFIISDKDNPNRFEDENDEYINQINCDDSFFTFEQHESKKLQEMYDYYTYITLNSINISTRSYNCLQNAGIYYLSQLLEMNSTDIRNIKSLGSKSFREIMFIRKKFLYHYYELQKEKEVNCPNNNSDISLVFLTPKIIKLSNENDICINGRKEYVHDTSINKVINNLSAIKKLEKLNVLKLSDLLLKGVDEIIYTNFSKKDICNEIVTDIKSYIENNLIIPNNEKSLFKVISQKISAYVEEYKFKGVSRIDTINFFSEKYSKENVLSVIEQLVEERTLFIYEDDKLFFRYDSFPSFLYSIRNNIDVRLKDIMFSRIDGVVLEEIAKKYGTTRELIRQQESKFFKKYVYNDDNIIRVFKEDKYEYLFTTYDIKKDDFITIFSEKERTYNYLKLRYKHGKKLLFESINDLLLPKRFRALIEKYFDKDFYIIDGNKIRAKKGALLNYYCSKNLLTQLRLNDVIDGFNDFIKEYDEKFQILTNDHTAEGYISRLNNIVQSLYRKYRYYDYSLYDWEFFFNEINLESYDGLEIYTSLLFRKHHHLMEKYNILDCYELHNILKKMYDNNEFKISFGRMPQITIGKFNKKEYLLKVLEEHGELTNKQFAEILDEQLGIGQQALSWLLEIKEYSLLDKYIFNYDNKIDETLLTILSKTLTDDFYFISEVEKIIEINNYIFNNSHALFKVLINLGYNVYSKCIIKNSYSQTSYFKEKLLENDILNINDFRKCQVIGVFNETFKDLQMNYDIIKFDEHTCINFRKLESSGISKQDLIDYAEAVIEIVGEKYFTIHSLNKSGFSSKLEELGFDDIFFESILKNNYRISSFKLNNKSVFRRTNSPISRKTFINSIIEEYRYIGTDDLINLLKENYGLNIDILLLKLVTEDTDIYYNSIMDTFYINYQTFLEEV